ncbi:MAG: hypothetical protein B0D92_06205 [Spirochaeta sp. LUC14_002_19_P3]|nr:MAG: hypothetical protein B0D92_06205 [Spirochaeta sp. LUC14_002_19_P3]
MILAADIGTSSLKAGLLSPSGELRKRVCVHYRRPPGLGGEEFNPLEWEWAFCEALRQLPAASITAVGISGNGPTLVPTDEQGNPLAPAVMWHQERGVPLEGQPSYYLPKAAWLKAHESAWPRTRWLFSPPEWLQFRLTARPSMGIPHETFQPYVWDENQIKAYGFDSKIFPEPVVMGRLAGRVTREGSALSGLPEGTLFAAVGSDFMAALLGSGTVEPGMVCDRAGTSEGINYCARQPSGNPLLRDLPHLMEGLWNVAAILPSTGAVFEWYRRLIDHQNKPYEETLAAVDGIAAGLEAPLFFPGHRNGIPWSFAGGSLHYMEPWHGGAHIGRAVMEAIAYGVRRGIELLEASGMRTQEIRVSGGQARGRVWNQMKADITNRRLYIPMIEDAELAGCAACAVKALGGADSLLEAAACFVSARYVVEPRQEITQIYNESYRRYLEQERTLSG